MQLQSDKNTSQRKIEARKALGGEKMNHIDENKKIDKQVERKQTITAPKKEITVPQKNKTESGKKEKVEERAKKAIQPTFIQPKAEKRTQGKAFLEKIRPKDKRGKPLRVEKDKKIERVLSQKNIDNKNYNIQTIRTYKSDIADAIKKKGESLTKIAIQEKKKERAIEVKKTPKKKKLGTKNILLIVGILIIVISGGGLMYQLHREGLLVNLFKKPIKEKTILITTAIPTMPSLIPINTERKINISNNKENLTKIISEELKRDSSVGDVENIYLYKITDTVINEKVQQKQEAANPVDLISLWENEVPNPLTRALEEKFMLGIYSTQMDGNTPFLILTTSSYAQTFAGMIKWEQTLLDDLYKLFSIGTVTQINNSFQDKVIAEKDTRILTNINNEILVLYSFVDKKTVIITTSKEAFSGILQKLGEN